MSTFTTDSIPKRRISRRRGLFFSLIFGLTCLATWFTADLFERSGGINGLEWAILVVFVILFAHISIGFVTAMLGFYVRNRGGDSRRILRSLPSEGDTPLAPTAVLLPCFNEDVSRVFEGLRVIYRSVQETGKLEHFDFFILSDSNQPNQWIQEEVAWLELCKQVSGFGRIFYRKRRLQINKKAGNVADFLRRWGKRYRYFVVLDADSIMSGRTLVQMVQLMERNARLGILQTAPRLARAETPYARMQAFAMRLYGPLFLDGLNYWMQHDGNYWGHNAIIRTQPFMDHCALPDLPGSEPFGGRILSHDFVEAALMRKAGWQVWLAAELEGTYEEGPPTLIDAAKRDRRWCQGNLQHTWLLTARGFPPVNRLHLFMGVMGYVASPLWLAFLVLSTAHVFSLAAAAPDPAAPPPVQAAVFGVTLGVPEAFMLFVLTMVLLFAPKVAAASAAVRDRERASSFGGRGALIASALVEAVASSLLAPINMMFHAKFVVFTLLGQGVSWVTQRRGVDDDEAAWREAIITHAGQTAFGLVWGVSSFILVPTFFWWLSPVLAGLVLTVPLSIVLGRVALGHRLRQWGLFLVPEETQPPYELRRLEQNLAECYKHMQPLESLRTDYGLMQAVLDPYVNALHVSLLRQREPAEETRDWLQHLRMRLLSEGPHRLTAKEKLGLLYDAESMSWLHRELWTAPAGALAEWWRLAMRQYNVLTAAPVTALYR